MLGCLLWFTQLSAYVDLLECFASMRRHVAMFLLFPWRAQTLFAEPLDIPYPDWKANPGSGDYDEPS